MDLIFKITKLFGVEISHLFTYTTEEDTFQEISEEDIKNSARGKKFLEFKQDVLKRYVEANDLTYDEIFKSLGSDQNFISHELSIYSSDLINTISNENCSKILKRKVGTRTIAGINLKEQKVKVSIINRIYGKEEIYFTTTNFYNLGGKVLRTNCCNCYKSSPEKGNLLLGYLVDYTEV